MLLLTLAGPPSAVPEDTKFSDIWGLHNPVMVGSGGDPKDIATFVEACFNGSTLWPSGAAMVIDNDITFSLHQQNKDVDAQLTPEDMLDPFDIDLTQLKDLTGRPISEAKLESIKALRAEGFKAKAAMFEAMAAEAAKAEEGVPPTEQAD